MSQRFLYVYPEDLFNSDNETIVIMLHMAADCTLITEEVGQVTTSCRAIAARTGLSKDKVQRRLNKLREQRFIRAVDNGGDRFIPTTWTLHFDDTGIIIQDFNG